MKKAFIYLIFTVVFISCSKEPQTLEELKKAGEVAFIKEDYPAARKYLIRALKAKPSDRDMLYLLSLSYQRDYLLDSALFYIKRADLLFPNDREINLILYRVADELKEWEYAIKAIHVLIKTGDPVEQYYKRLVDLNMNNGDTLTAFIFARKLWVNEAKSPDQYIQLANFATLVDSVDLAIQLMNNAIEEFGEKEEFLLNKGIYYSVMRKYDIAENVFRKLLSRDTASISVKLNLANVLTKQNQRKKKLEGLRLYKEIKSAVSNYFNVDSTITVLEEELNLK